MAVRLLLNESEIKLIKTYRGENRFPGGNKPLNPYAGKPIDLTVFPGYEGRFFTKQDLGKDNVLAGDFLYKNNILSCRYFKDINAYELTPYETKSMQKERERRKQGSTV